MILDEKIKITAFSFDERGISPGESEDSPVTYTFPQRLVDWRLAKRLICFYTSFYLLPAAPPTALFIQD